MTFDDDHRGRIDRRKSALSFPMMKSQPWNIHKFLMVTFRGAVKQ